MINYKRLPKVFVILFLGMVTTPLWAAEDPLAELDDYINKYMKTWNQPGLAISVTLGDKTIVAKGYGTRTVGKNEPVDEHTRFAIGSQSKYFTAIALAMLADEGKLSFDDHMVEHLPGFQVGDEMVTGQTTLRDALSHRTGVRGGFIEVRSRPNMSRKEALGLMKHLPLVEPFRAGWVYNNYMIMAAGEIIPEITGKSWDKFVGDRIFKPLGMKNSSTLSTRFNGNTNVATPHSRFGKDKTPVAIPHGNIDNWGPAGSISSSVSDMAKWFRFHYNGGTVNGRRLVSEESLAETRKMHAITKPRYEENFSGYGLAISISESGGYRVYGHAGGTDGMISYGSFVPELKLGVSVLTNMNSRLASAIARWVVDRYTGAENVDWAAKAYDSAVEYENKAKQELADLKSRAENFSDESSLPLSSYVGNYSSKLMGEVKVREENGRLVYVYGENFTGFMEPLYLNTFLMTQTEPLAWAFDEKPVQFTVNMDGSVKALIMQGDTYTKE